MSWTLRLQTGDGSDVQSVLVLSKVGRRSPWETVAIDATGQACRRAMMVDDEILPSTGVVASSYETAAGRWLGKDEIVACDVDGDALPVLSSTKDSVETIEPATVEDILEHVAVAIYEVQAVRLDPSLEVALRMGEMFRTRFRPRATAQERAAFLIAREGTTFLILGERLEFTVATRETPLPPEEDAIEDDWDDEGWLSMDEVADVGSVPLHARTLSIWEEG